MFSQPAAPQALPDRRQPPVRLSVPVWVGLLAGGTLVLVVMALTPGTVLRDLLYVVLSASVVVAIVVGVRAYRPVVALPWLVMAAAQVLWLVADALLYFLQDFLDDDRFPSYPDAFYLGGYVFMALALHLLVRARRRARELPALLDAATVTVGLGLLTWVYLAQPLLRGTSQSTAATVVSVSYVLADIVLIGALVRLLLSSRTGSTPLRLLMLALLLLIGADFLSAALDNYNYALHPTVELMWPASYVVWGAAALHPRMAALTEADDGGPQRSPWLRLGAMTTATLVAPGILVVQSLAGREVDVWTVVVGSVAMFLLVMARMDLAMAEIARGGVQRQLLQAELVHSAEHDPLTQLPNRATTVKLLSEALTNRAEGSTVAVLFLDLDGFKAVNDTYGHRAGDTVLCVVADRLRHVVREGDVATRLGGDEFVVLLPGVPSEGPALAVAQRIITSISQPITVDDGHLVRVGASVGVALGHDDTATPDELLHQADLALYRAKTDGRGRTVLFGEQLRAQVTGQAALALAIGQAIENDELVLHYQPVHSLRSGDLRGFEALVRWDRPGHGLQESEDFLPAGELADLVCRIDAWALRTAARDLADFEALSGRHGHTMTVNVSARHAARSRIGSDVLSAIADAGIEPHQLVVQVAESVFVEYPSAEANLRELRDLGVSISLQDYGRGYSAVGMLSSLPVSMVKISGHHFDPSAAASRSVLELMVLAAHSEGLPVVGERVEDARQLEVLREVACEAAQGSYVGPPVPAGHLGRFLVAGPEAGSGAR